MSFREFPAGKDILNTSGWPILVYLALSELNVADMGETFAGEIAAKGYRRQPVPRPVSTNGLLSFQETSFDTAANAGWPTVRAVAAVASPVGGEALAAWDLDAPRDMSLTSTVLTVEAVYQK